MGEQINGDTKIILQSITGLGKQVGRLEEKVDKYNEKTESRLNQCAIQTALQEQATRQICKDIEDVEGDIDNLERRLDLQDRINKIIGGLTAGLYAVAALFGFRQ